MKELKAVNITTTEGDVYLFPAMEQTGLAVLRAGCRRGHAGSMLTLSNVSGACLVLPARIIASVQVDGEEIWTPSCVA